MVLCKNTLPHTVRLYGHTTNVSLLPNETLNISEELAAVLPDGVHKVKGKPAKQKKITPTTEFKKKE